MALRNLDRDAFVEAAAQQLLGETRRDHLDPAGQRALAERLGEEGGHRVRADVITDERWRRDTEQAVGDDLGGLRQLLSEATSREQAALLKSALRLIERSGEDPQRLYVVAAQAGQVYEGRLEGKNARVALVRLEDDRVLACAPQGLRLGQQTEKGRVRFTARQQQGMDLEW